MSEREITPEVQQLLNNMGCTLVPYTDEQLGIDVSLAMPGSSTVESLKRIFAGGWQEALEFRWTVLQEGLQKALINRTDISVKAAPLVRVGPSPEQIAEDVFSLSSTFGDIPKPIPYPLMDTENFKPDSTKIGYLVFERIL